MSRRVFYLPLLILSACGGSPSAQRGGVSMPSESINVAPLSRGMDVATPSYVAPPAAAYRADIPMSPGAPSSAPYGATAPRAGGQGHATTQGDRMASAANESQNTASDAVHAGEPMLIYTAVVTMAVFEVEKVQAEVLKAIKELNGYLAEQTQNRLVIRVPSNRFRDAFSRIETLGDVLDRNIQVSDVTEQFNDIVIRIRNAEAMRDRLESLLKNAANVEEALRIERELERITEVVETMKGRLRYLSDRLAFSTITVQFQPRPVEQIQDPDAFRLPFEWLRELGLSTLLRLQ